jgi:hypothetical protein
MQHSHAPNGAQFALGARVNRIVKPLMVRQFSSLARMQIASNSASLLAIVGRTGDDDEPNYWEQSRAHRIPIKALFGKRLLKTQNSTLSVCQCVQK